MPSGKVLLVDDEQDFTDVLSERLETRGLKVESAANGNEAIEKVNQADYDVILLDLVMPEMDGLQTLQKIREKRPDLQIIFLTGHADLKSGIEAIKLGASDFLEKPANIQQITEKVKEAAIQKAILVEEEQEEKIKKILKSKGW